MKVDFFYVYILQEKAENWKKKMKERKKETKFRYTIKKNYTSLVGQWGQITIMKY